MVTVAEPVAARIVSAVIHCEHVHTYPLRRRCPAAARRSRPVTVPWVAGGHGVCGSVRQVLSAPSSGMSILVVTEQWDVNPVGKSR
jgi:hypothetical protein